MLILFRKAAFRVGTILTTFLIAVTATGHAQLTSGTINGSVQDQSGAAVPGATVTVKNVETGVVRSTVSSPTGRYEVPNLQPGSYEVTVTAAGFQTSVRSGIDLSIGRIAVVDHGLQVGNVAEQVTVTGEAPLIETTTATVAQVIDVERRVEELPLRNRDLTQFAFLQPGVIKSPAGVGGIQAGMGDKITVAGARGTQNLFLMDGVSNSDLSSNPQGAGGAYTGAETVKEFQVVVNNYSAEYQSAAGAIVSAVTKSGTNALHGSAFWTVRNDNLDAAKWEDNNSKGKGEFKQNQYGGSLGGPIMRDRTFYFASFEGLRERAMNTDTITTFTDAGRRGQGVRGNPPNANTPAPIVNVNVDPRIVPYLALWPVPGVGNTPLPGKPADEGTIVIAAFERRPVDDDTATGKLDHHLSNEKAGNISVTYSWNDSSRLPCGLLCDLTEIGTAATSSKQTLAVNHTSVLSHTLINEIKFGYSLSEVAGDLAVGSRDTSALRFHPDRDRVGEIGVTSSLTRVGYRVNPQATTQKALQFKEGVSFTTSNHSFRFGTEIKRFRYVQDACSRGCNGIFAFNSLADFLTNNANDFQVFRPGAESPVRHLRQLLFGAYFQDNWQVANSLTFNLGMRYEFVTVPDEDDHLISTLESIFDPFVSVTEQVAAQYTNEPRPFVKTDIEEFFQNPTLKSFSPRFGFAWAPGNKTFSVRGGYGIFYDYPVLYQLRTSLQELPPFVETARLRATGSGSIPAGRTLSMAPNVVNQYLDLINSPTFSTFNLRYMEPNQSNSYIHRWSLTLQKAFGSDWVTSAGYTGSRGLHLLHQTLPNIRRWDGFPNAPTGRKHFSPGAALVNPNFGEMRAQSSNANSFFHGLAVGVQKRMTHGLQVQLAYNYSKAIDEGSGVTSGGDEFAQGQRGIYYWDMKEKRGLASFDIRNTLTTNFTYEFPTRGLTGIAGAVAGGWQVNGILTLTDGYPLSVHDNSTTQNTLIGSVESLRVNLVPGGDANPVLGGPDRYFDTSQFQPSEPGYFGTLGRNTLISPGLATMDFSVQKNFQFLEAHRVQFRAEFFNLFNRPNFGTPATTIFTNGVLAADAGRISMTRTSARQIQFGLRYSF
jgi:hypothetical protein